MERRKIGLVIPALNEASSIEKVITSASDYGQVIVVDDGSQDDTAAISRRAGAIVVSHDHNRGYDAALGSGFAKAVEIGCEIVITLDADGQHDPTLVSAFIEKINAGADVVLGVRNKKPRLGEYLFSFVTCIFYDIRDPLCGMKAYRSNVYSSLGYFDSYRSIGTELMLHSVASKFKISEVDFFVRERKDTPRFGGAYSANKKILRSLAIHIWRKLAFTRLNS